MHPFGDNSPIKSFLDKNNNGALHHICIEVKDIFKACDEIKKNGVRVLGDGTPKNGAHDKPVIFLTLKIFWNTYRTRTGVTLFGLESLVIYIIFWWLVFFIALPFGVSRENDVIHGNDPGAPKKTLLKKSFNLFTCIIYFNHYFFDYKR